MLTTAVRCEREDLSGAHWEAWMRLAGATTFHLIGGAGARPERTTADDALALAQGTCNRLGRTLAHAVATQSTVGWLDVLRWGFAPVRKVLLDDPLCAEYVIVDDARSRRYIYTAMTAAFCDLVSGERPRYKMGARVAHMRCVRYQSLYDVVRGHLQCVADEAAANAWRIR